MSYQVLARKWRPHTFAHVVGQQHVLKPLINALQTGRLHHAWLLTGTRGVGKTTIARILAKSLNCEQGLTAEPCGQCGACKAIEEGRFVDLLEIDAASRTKVEDTRELLDNVQYKPTQGRYKVYLIDEVHMLSKHSFNALLKTLEEPPEHVKFLLATTDPHKLPITVLSRCLQFNLKALGRAEIANHLATVLTAEGIPFDESALGLLARAAQGSMRDALSLTDQAIAQGEQAVTLEAVQQMLGAVPNLQLVKLLRAIIRGDAATMMGLLEQVAGQVPDVASLLPELQNLIHQLALLQVIPTSAEALGVGATEVELASQLPAELIQVYYDILVQGRRDLNYAADTRAGVEITLLRMLAFRPQAMVLPEASSEVTPAPSPKLAAEPVAEVPPPSEPEYEAAFEPEFEPEFESEFEQQPEVEDALASEPTGAVELAAQSGAEPMVADDLQALLATRALLQQQSQQLASKQPDNINEGSSRYRAAVSQAEQPKPHAPAAAQAEQTAAATAKRQPVAAGSAAISDDTRLAAEIDRWAAMIDNLELTGITRQIARSTVLHKQADGTYQLLLRESFSSLLSDSVVQTLQQRLLHSYDLQVSEVVVASTSQPTPFELQQQIDQRRLARARQLLVADPTVQALATQLAAELVEDSIKPL